MLEQRFITWIASATTYFTLSTTAVILRLIAVYLRGSGYRFQDGLVVLAWVCSIGYNSTTSVGVAQGSYGVPVADVIANDPGSLVVALKTLWVGQWFWATGTASFRIAILLFYHDIFPEKRFKQAVAGSIALVSAYWVASLLTIALLCRPVGRNWDTTRTDTCGDVRSLELFSAAFAMILDLWVVFLPLPTIWGLKLSSSKKWAVSTSFLLGLLTAGINLGRLIHTINCDPLLGVTYCLLDAVIMNLGEQSMGIIVACAPTLGVIFVRKRQRQGYTRSTGPARPSGQASADSGFASSRKKSASQKFIDSLLSTKTDSEAATTITKTRNKGREGSAEDIIELSNNFTTGQSEPLGANADPNAGGDTIGTYASVTHPRSSNLSVQDAVGPTPPPGLQIVYSRDYSVRQDDRPGIAR